MARQVIPPVLPINALYFLLSMPLSMIGANEKSPAKPERTFHNKRGVAPGRH